MKNPGKDGGQAAEFPWVRVRSVSLCPGARTGGQDLRDSEKMPDVVDAYRQMGARIPDTDRLSDSRGVGEG